MSSTWVPVPDGSDFPLSNLPYGSFSLPTLDRRLGVAIGDHVLDVGAVVDLEPLRAPNADRLMAAGPAAWREARARIQDVLASDRSRGEVEPHLHPRSDVRLHLPFTVADYVDFYSSRHHAENLGRLFRPGSDPLTPNWLHQPIGYHGRAGTVVVSGTGVVRPRGQLHVAPDLPPSWAPSARLDLEAEVGFVVGAPTAPGTRVPTTDFEDHVFGAVLVNDWSARDIQAWEYVPLGPFLGKSFATTVSPWVVPLEALRAARCAPQTQDPTPLPYLLPPGWGLNLTLEVELNGEVVSRPPFATTYWTPAQQLAHLTSNGSALRTGDLLASGTVSGPDRDQRGSLIELSWNGAELLLLASGESRAFLQDGDTVAIRACAPGADGTELGFGEARGTVLAARP